MCRMPEISRFFGIVIRMYFFDHDPPHFHAHHGDARARLRIDPLGLLDGDLPPRTLVIVVEWAKLHRDELLENWRRLHQDEPRNASPHWSSHAPARRRRRAEALLRRGTHVRGRFARVRGPLTLDRPPSQGVFAALRDPIVCDQVTVDHEAGTIVWPNGADLDPDVLYELVRGEEGEEESREGRGKIAAEAAARLTVA